MNIKRAIIYVSIFTLLSIIVALVYFVNPFRFSGKAVALDSMLASDGSKIYLMQEYNQSLGEPSSIYIHHELMNGDLYSYYIDHESSYWWSGRLVFDQNEKNNIQVFRGHYLEATLNISTSKIKLSKIRGNHEGLTGTKI
jgi:hypothetical protein